MNWADYLEPGMVAVDIGANVGDVTGALLAAGATVYAIEPHPETAAKLRGRFPEVTVIEAAVTDREGDVLLYPGRDSVHHSLYPPNVLNPTGEPVTVRGVTLDGLRARGELPARIDAIKIDAQGADGPILRGATALLASQQPVMLIEVWAMGLQAAGMTVRDVAALLQDAGYVPTDQRGWDQLAADTEAQTGHGSHDWLVIPAGSAV